MYDNLLLRAYNRIMDDAELESYVKDLLPLLDSPTGCLDVVASSTDYLISCVHDDLDTMQWVSESLASGSLHTTVLG